MSRAYGRVLFEEGVVDEPGVSEVGGAGDECGLVDGVDGADGGLRDDLDIVDASLSLLDGGAQDVLEGGGAAAAVAVGLLGGEDAETVKEWRDFATTITK